MIAEQHDRVATRGDHDRWNTQTRQYGDSVLLDRKCPTPSPVKKSPDKAGDFGQRYALQMAKVMGILGRGYESPTLSEATLNRKPQSPRKPYKTRIHPS